ncbi:1,2-dihydroxy-3-keto-5-methylthiopentene dioxygenase [Dokdonella sp.]|uniref:1,2-dihydroxy-3-keto-5-methylthiopentene dioxygenase n=1 Tax=Dokdonella sp. TaxID=2291710 RepID=UPI0031BF0FC8|nr:acireductone dioxygenase [Dokdonella sp.]
MTRLRIYPDDDATTLLANLTEPAAIARALGEIGVRFEQWQARQPIKPGDAPATVIAAYRADIDRLMREEGYQAVDVVSLAPDHPDRAALRAKFLEEHTHSEDEVRFFVAGAGQFSLHVGNKVYEVLCEAGDLIGVPDRTRHWFDMSESPYFVAIRLFTNKEGWVAEYSGDPIASRYPRMAPHPSAASA